MLPLLNDIQAFLSASDMPPTRFGELALNDKGFVIRLRKGRRVWPETEEKVRAFMRDWKPEELAEAAAPSETPAEQDAA